MERRKRINLSVDPDTYGRLRAVQEAEGFLSLPRLCVAALRLYLQLREEGEGRWSLPDDEADWLAGEFDRLGEAEREKPGYHRAGPFNPYTR